MVYNTRCQWARLFAIASRQGLAFYGILAKIRRCLDFQDISKLEMHGVATYNELLYLASCSRTNRDFVVDECPMVLVWGKDATHECRGLTYSRFISLFGDVHVEGTCAGRLRKSWNGSRLLAPVPQSKSIKGFIIPVRGAIATAITIQKQGPNSAANFSRGEIVNMVDRPSIRSTFIMIFDSVATCM